MSRYSQVVAYTLVAVNIVFSVGPKIRFTHFFFYIPNP